MGTNYYVNTPACPNACEHCGATERLHLGKSSIGWRFLFRAEPEWLRDGAFAHWVSRAASGKITDEYGEGISLADLIDLIDRKKDTGSHLEPHPGCGAPPTEIFRCCGHEFAAREFS